MKCQIETFTCEVPIAIIIHGSCPHAGDFPTTVLVRRVPAFFGFAGILNEVGNMSDMSK